MSTTLHVVTAVNYTESVPLEKYPAVKDKVVQSAISVSTVKSNCFSDIWYYNLYSIYVWFDKILVSLDMVSFQHNEAGSLQYIVC